MELGVLCDDPLLQHLQWLDLAVGPMGGRVRCDVRSGRVVRRWCTATRESAHFLPSVWLSLFLRLHALSSRSERAAPSGRSCDRSDLGSCSDGLGGGSVALES